MREQEHLPGPHGYIASLPSDYESNSNNPKAGSGNFVNGFNFTASLGTIQVVNTAFSSLDPNPYIPSLYESDDTAIPTTSPIDWLLDTYAGVLFVQDYDSGVVPGYIDAWLYIGDMASEVSSSSVPDGTISSSRTDYTVRICNKFSYIIVCNKCTNKFDDSESGALTSSFISDTFISTSVRSGFGSGGEQSDFNSLINVPSGLVSSSDQILPIATSSITNFDTEVSRSVPPQDLVVVILKYLVPVSMYITINSSGTVEMAWWF